MTRWTFVHVDHSGEERLMTRIGAAALALVFSLGLAACATPGAQPGEMEIRRGTIEQITAVQLPDTHHQGVGAVVGGLAGLGIGSLIGGGTGRDVAMVAGTIGGALDRQRSAKEARPAGARTADHRAHDGGRAGRSDAAGQCGAARRPARLHRG